VSNSTAVNVVKCFSRAVFTWAAIVPSDRRNSHSFLPWVKFSAVLLLSFCSVIQVYVSLSAWCVCGFTSRCISTPLGLKTLPVTLRFTSHQQVTAQDEEWNEAIKLSRAETTQKRGGHKGSLDFPPERMKSCHAAVAMKASQKVLMKQIRTLTMLKDLSIKLTFSIQNELSNRKCIYFCGVDW